jgi:hypothetical protein
MRDELGNTHKLFGLKVELHVGRMLLEMVEKLLRGSTHNVVDFIDLVKLIIAREKREE